MNVLAKRMSSSDQEVEIRLEPPAANAFHLTPNMPISERTDLIASVTCDKCKQPNVAYRDDNLDILATCQCTDKQILHHYGNPTTQAHTEMHPTVSEQIYSCFSQSK